MAAKLNKEEIEYIRVNSKNMSVRQIAKALGRSIRTIELVRQNFEQEISEARHREKIKDELYHKFYWPVIKKQLTEEEVPFFADMWANLVTQFSDLVETEEHQIVDYVRIEILKNRNLTERARSSRRLLEIQIDLDGFQNRFGPPPYVEENISAQWINLNEEVGFHQGSFQNRTEEFKKFQERQEALRKDMKATRALRIQSIQDSRHTFQDYIKMLLEDKYRAEQGRMLAIMRAAAEKERQRLSELHSYADGTIDIPILNSETVEGPEEVGRENNEEYSYEEQDEEK